MLDEPSPVGATPDVSTSRLADLLTSRDPTLIRAIETLVAQLRTPADVGSNWPSFLKPSAHGEQDEPTETY